MKDNGVWHVLMEYPNSTSEKQNFLDPYRVVEFLQQRAEEVVSYLAVIKKNGEKWELRHGVKSDSSGGDGSSRTQCPTLDWDDILKIILELGKDFKTN